MLEITVAKPYLFKENIHGHGWIALAPCSWHDEPGVFRRVERLSTGKVVLLDVTGAETGDSVQLRLEVQAVQPITNAEKAEILQSVRFMLRLDEDFSAFYALAAAHPELWKSVGRGRGRLLRSPSLFEDVVKTICTTNTTWAQTKQMVSRIVNTLGDPLPSSPNLRAFPTATQVAEAGEGIFEKEIRLGYRNAYVLQLARDIAEGRRDLESLKTAALPSKELKKALKSIKGVGDYAANTLLMLLGNYEALAIDSATREFTTKKYFNGTLPTDKEIAAIYEPFGNWKYLAYWFDMID